MGGAAEAPSVDDESGNAVAELGAGYDAAVASVGASVLVASYSLVAWSVASVEAYVGEGYSAAVWVAVAPEVAGSAVGEPGVE